MIKNRKNGFTLSELLLALGIIGVIAVMTVPVLINNVSNKTYATQLKNMAATIEQLAQDEMIANRTRDLANTDFSNPTALLTSKHFSISKLCPSSTALKDCWKTSATDNSKVTYKKLNKVTQSINAQDSVILKNGVILNYNLLDTTQYNAYSVFVIDVNGNDGPNIAGRDLFVFYLSQDGRVIGYCEAANINASYSSKISNCKSSSTNAPHYCFDALMENNWKMDY